MIIDGLQMIPELLDEVQRLIVHRRAQFVLWEMFLKRLWAGEIVAR